MNHLFPFALLALFLLGSAFGQDAAVDIARAVRDLGAKPFQVRRQARRTLAELGWTAKAELEQAAKNADPEVADVARQLLAEILPGVTGSTPTMQRRLVERYIKAETPGRALRCAELLLQEEPTPHAVLLGLLDWETDTSQQRALVGIVLDMHRWYFLPLLVRGDNRTYERLLGWAARLEMSEAIPWIAAYAYHRDKLGEMRQQTAALMGNEGSPFYRELLAVLHLLAGHEGEALAVAREADWPFLEQMLSRTGKWGELARELPVRVAKPTDLQRLQLAAAQRLAGHDGLAVATLHKVMAHDEKGNRSGLLGAAGGAALGAAPVHLGWQGMGRRFVVGSDAVKAERRWVFGAKEDGRQQKVLAWKCLLAFGLTGDAIHVLLDQREMGTAVDILLARGEYEQAERLSGAAIAAAEPKEKWVLEIRRAGLLKQMGDGKAVATVRDILERCRNGEAEMAANSVVRLVVRALYQAGFRELLAEQLPGLLVRFEGKQGDTVRMLVSSLSCDGYDGSFWWDCLAKAAPEQGLVARATRVQDFLSGRLSADEAHGILQLGLSSEAPVRERVRGLMAVARTSALLGRQAEAEAAYATAVRCAAETGDPDLEGSVCWVSFPVFGPLGKWSELADAQGRMGETGEPDCLAKQACFLAWGGDREAGRKLAQRAMALTLADDAYHLLSSLLSGRWQEVRRVLPLVVVGPAAPGYGAPQAARAVKDYALELRLAQRAWYAQVCSGGDFGPAGLLAINAELAFAECRAMAGAGESAKALAQAKRVANAFPDDVDGLADTVEALEWVGAEKEADELVAHALSLQRKILAAVPNSAHCLNNLAWLCARTRRGMAEGEACARRAVEIAPTEDTIIHTLAVLLYRQGDVAGGIELARKSVRMSPYDHHHLHQLGRWLEEQRQKK